MVNQAEFPVQALCRVLNVSRSAYYDWRKRVSSARKQENAQLIEDIRTIHAESDSTYGMPRIRAELKEQGWTVSRRRVARLMRIHGLRGVCRRRYQVTTKRDLRQRPAPDLVNRQFVADEPNHLWVADATFVPTGVGFIYLAIVLDVWSRRVVGWAIGESLDTDLMLDALNMALEQRQPENVIHHSDQGCQYTSLAFSNRCKAMRVRASMGSVGDAYGRVEMWRGGSRQCISVSATFVWRCLTSITITPFPHPARRTGRADFPHPALFQYIKPSHSHGRR